MRQRKVGLDILRILAMFMVIFCHSGCFSLGQNPTYMEFSGIVAVEVFFSLSGFLVGKTIIQAATSQYSLKKMEAYYITRFFRIVPLYFVMLFMTMIITKKSIPLSCFFFLQNFNEEYINFFPPTWTLSIEFWFYFLISTFFYILVKQFRRLPENVSVFTSILILLIFFFAVRIYFSLYTPYTWDYGIRKQIFLRMDALLLGMLLAAYKLYRKDRFQKIFSSALCPIIYLIGILSLYYYPICGQRSTLETSVSAKLFLFSVLPVLSCFIVGYMDQVNWVQSSTLSHITTSISHLSYCIYLIHLNIFWIVSPLFANASFSVSWLGFLGSIFITFLISAFIFQYIEKPIDKIKNKSLSRLNLQDA